MQEIEAMESTKAPPRTRQPDDFEDAMTAIENDLLGKPPASDFDLAMLKMEQELTAPESKKFKKIKKKKTADPTEAPDSVNLDAGPSEENAVKKKKKKKKVVDPLDAPEDNDAVKAALAALRQDGGDPGPSEAPIKRIKKSKKKAISQQQGDAEGGGPLDPAELQDRAPVSNYVEKMKGQFAAALNSERLAVDAALPDRPLAQQYGEEPLGDAAEAFEGLMRERQQRGL